MVTRLTAMVIMTNEVSVIETDERCEAWLIRDGEPHALLLSCPLENRSDMDAAIASIKNGEVE